MHGKRCIKVVCLTDVVINLYVVVAIEFVHISLTNFIRFYRKKNSVKTNTDLDNNGTFLKLLLIT